MNLKDKRIENLKDTSKSDTTSKNHKKNETANTKQCDGPKNKTFMANSTRNLRRDDCFPFSTLLN